MKYNRYQEIQCPKCERHIIPIRNVRKDKKSNKFYTVLQCPKCEREFDLEDNDES